MARRWASRGLLLVAIAALLGGALLTYSTYFHGADMRGGSVPLTLVPPGTPSPGSVETAAGPATSPAPDDPFAVALRCLGGGASPEETEKILAALASQLRALPPAESARRIVAFLVGGKDAATGQEFELTGGGDLAGAPTLRLYLLDLLARIDPAAAAQFSREILQSRTSADEWAIAMRNIGRVDPDAKGYLAGKFQEMIGYEPWRQAPTAGFLEAFDVAVFSESVTVLPVLTQLMDQEEAGIDRAAQVAMDRLAGADPGEVLSYLSGNPGVLAATPLLRADLYAKADLRDLAQRRLVEAHLADSAVGMEEKEKLILSLGRQATFVSDNLLTPAKSAYQGLRNARHSSGSAASGCSRIAFQHSHRSSSMHSGDSGISVQAG